MESLYNELGNCYWHEGEITSSFYIRCYECGHAYITEEELEVTYRETADKNEVEVDKAKKASDILFCPLCLHDW